MLGKRSMRISRRIAAAAVVMSGVIVTGAVAEVRESRQPATGGVSGAIVEDPLSIESRPGECVGHLHFTWASEAKGAATPHAAVRRWYPEASNVRVRSIESDVVLEQLEGTPAKVIAAYRVSRVEGGSWVLSVASRSRPCNTGDPAMPKPMKGFDRNPR